jgi:hypothetical protein
MTRHLMAGHLLRTIGLALVAAVGMSLLATVGMALMRGVGVNGVGMRRICVADVGIAGIRLADTIGSWRRNGGSAHAIAWTGGHTAAPMLVPLRATNYH